MHKMKKLKSDPLYTPLNKRKKRTVYNFKNVSLKF